MSVFCEGRIEIAGHTLSGTLAISGLQETWDCYPGITGLQ